MDIITTAGAFIIGAASAAIAAIKYLGSRFSQAEIEVIRKEVATAIADYEQAKQDGKLTADEKIKLAEDVLALIQEALKALEG